MDSQTFKRTTCQQSLLTESVSEIFPSVPFLSIIPISLGLRSGPCVAHILIHMMN